MWELIGVDDDKERHRCRTCKTKEEAERYMSEAMASLERMKMPYKADLARSYKEHLKIMDMPEDERPLYYEYMGWKMQGFFIERFELEYREDY